MGERYPYPGIFWSTGGGRVARQPVVRALLTREGGRPAGPPAQGSASPAPVREAPAEASDASAFRGRNGSGRGPDAGRTIEFKEADVDRTRAG
eukprot:gene21617-biopygen11681